MRRIQMLVMSLILVLMFLVACAPEAAPAPAAPAPAPQLPVAAAPAPSAPTKAAWEVEWEKVQTGARQEKLLAFATTAARTELAKGFQGRFGMRAESVSATAGLLVSKILAEQRAGLYFWDAFIGGAGTQITTFKPRGGTAPLEPTFILPDLTDPEVIKKVWFGGELPWVDKDRHILAPLSYSTPLLAINTKMVKPGEIRILDDLLDPKWKGKMLLLDPSRSGKTASSVLPMFYEVKGEAWVRKLAQQEPVITPDARITLDWLAHGKYPVVIGPREEDLVAFLEAGAPIAAFDVEDIGILSGGSSPLSLVRKAPHPNAAKAFINWYLSKEGQTIYIRGYGAPSGRLDVPTEGLPSFNVVRPGRNYFNSIREEIYVKVDDYRNKSKEIFGIK